MSAIAIASCFAISNNCAQKSEAGPDLDSLQVASPLIRSERIFKLVRSSDCRTCSKTVAGGAIEAQTQFGGKLGIEFNHATV